MAKPVAPGVVESQDAAHRRHAAGCGVRSELPAKASQVPIELTEHNTRLHRYGVAVNAHNPAHRLAEIDDQPSTERFAGQAGARAAGVQRDVLLGGVLN